jgi:glucose-6-phosphate dehydrogenase-like protein
MATTAKPKPKQEPKPKTAPPPPDEVEAENVEEGPKPAPPGTMVIFGATGDLTKRKLFPALYNLAASGLLPDELAIVGMGRTEISTEDFRKTLKDELH